MCIWLASGFWVVKLLSSVDNLVLRVKELGQLSNLQFLHSNFADFFLSRLARALEQDVRQFEGVNTTAFVSNQHNRVLLVERHMECGQLVSNGVEAAQLTVLLLVKIIHLELTFVSDGSKHGGRVGSPLDITDRAAHIEADDRSLHVDKPHLDGPISRAGEEDLGVKGVPLYGVNGQVMTFVGLEILTRVCLRAQVDLSFLSSDQEQMVLVRVEVEAHTTGETVSERLLLVIEEFLVLVNDQLQLDTLLSLKLVLHEVPVSYTAVRRDRVEV